MRQNLLVGASGNFDYTGDPCFKVGIFLRNMDDEKLREHAVLHTVRLNTFQAFKTEIAPSASKQLPHGEPLPWTLAPSAEKVVLRMTRSA